MIDLVGLHGWPMLLAMAAAAVLIGFSKTSFGGVGNLSVAVFALALPAKESTATVLLLLLVGDVIAVLRYRQVSWPLLRRLLPGVLPGLLAGALFMNFVDDTTMRRTIGALLVVMVALMAWQRRHPGGGVPADNRRHRVRTAGTGAAAGFATMTANAAGPVMALYLLAARVDKRAFIGTNAWFFFLINLCKVPLAASLGLFHPGGLLLDLVMVPAVLAGTVIGVRVIRTITQRQFEMVTIVASAVSAITLLVR